MRAFRVSRAELPRWHAELTQLEQRSVYPLGADAFRLSHGDDYFAFFERLGEVHYHALEEAGRLAVVGCGVLRQNPRRWYLADLKVHPDYRGRHLPLRLLRRNFISNWFRCARGYGIAMNPADGRVPPSVRLLEHFRWIPRALMHAEQLDLYSGDEAAMRAALPLLCEGRGTPHFVSLRGIKDLVLESTRQPLELLHLRFGPATDRRVFPAPQPGATHMWCLPRASPLTAQLASAGLAPSASATIVFHRLAGFDWSTVDTSEI